MSMVLKVFKIVTVPERLNASLFLDAMLGSQFMIVHKFGKNYSFIIPAPLLFPWLSTMASSIFSYT